jgi:hypothetical protein
VRDRLNGKDNNLQRSTSNTPKNVGHF